jgi:hypothetical protein
MSKWYEVTVTAVTVLAVEVEDSEGEDEAMKVACDEVDKWDEAKCHEVTGTEEIDRLKRHADEVLTIS